MSDPSDPRYDTRLDVLFGALERFDVQELAARTTHPWYNQSLCLVNDSVVRVGVLRGEYHWHHHDVEDELFFVIEGKLLVDLEGRTVELGPRQGLMVPHGTRHRTRAPERTIVLMVEPKEIVPTGS